MGDTVTPMSFEFDQVFYPDLAQKDIYLEMEELVLGALDTNGQWKNSHLDWRIQYIKRGRG
eukprot:8366648-Ditylum_brightwellii.AAC.1